MATDTPPFRLRANPTFTVERLADAPVVLLELWWYQSGLADTPPGGWTTSQQYLARELAWRCLEDLHLMHGD